MSTSFTNRVIKVSGEKIESMLATDSSFCFLSKNCKTPEEFREAFSKTISLATKHEVKYDAIISIKKDQDDDDVSVSSKGRLSIPVYFKFQDPADFEAFLTYCTQDLKLVRKDIQLAPWRSIRSHLIGLAIALVAVPFLYIQAVRIAAGEFVDTGDYSKTGRRTRFMNDILETVGPTGTLLIGLLVIGVTSYIAWKRYQNPPTQIQITP